MPPANIAATATIEPTASWAMPERPWPLVQPSAIRAPNSIRNPAANATAWRRAGAAVPSARAQMGEIAWRRAPDSFIEMSAPIAIPVNQRDLPPVLGQGRGVSRRSRAGYRRIDPRRDQTADRHVGRRRAERGFDDQEGRDLQEPDHDAGHVGRPGFGSERQHGALLPALIPYRSRQRRRGKSASQPSKHVSSATRSSLTRIK